MQTESNKARSYVRDEEISPLFHLSLSVVQADAPLRDQYYQTAFERMAIYHRRFVEKRPPPWTTKPAFRDFSFTNVHRELDAGTIVYMDELLGPLTALGASDGDVLAATIVYRWFNRVSTFRQSLAEPIQAGRFDAAEIEQRVRAQFGPPFTSATMVCAYDGYPGRDKLERVFLMLARIFD